MTTTRERWRTIGAYVIPAAVFLLVLLALFWRLWTPIDGARRAFGWDAQWEYWGDVQFQLDAYASGQFPWWNPFDRCGYPFFADPQAGILYPFTWGLVALSALVGAAWWVIAVKVIFHFWLAALGVYAFLRRRKLPVAACYVGGLVYVLTYPYIHNSFSALNWSAAWAPWALYAVDAWAAKPSWWRAAAVALALGMGELAGALAAFWYSLLVVVPYGVWAVVHHYRAATDRGAWLRTAAKTGALAAGLFLAIVAAQFDATSSLLPHTVRETRTLEFVGTTAFTGEDLFSFLVPRYPGSENCYIGFATLLWAVAAVSLKPSARSLVLAGTAVLGVLCAFGGVAPFLPFGASAVPPFGFFRRAHRYLYVAMLPLAILGAEGLAELARPRVCEATERAKRAGWFLLAAGALGVIVFGSRFVSQAGLPGKDDPYREAYAFALAAALVGTWVTWMIATRETTWKRVFLVVAAVVTALDLASSRHHVLDRDMHPVPRTPRDGQLARAEGVPLDVRIYDLEYLKFRPGLRRHVRDFGGYEDDPLSLSRYGKLLKAVRAAPRLLGHANVRWFFEEGRKTLKKGGLDQKALRSLEKGHFEVSPVAPAVYWTGQVLVVPGEDEALAELHRQAPGTVAVLERGEPTATGIPAAPPVPGRIVEHSLNRVVVDIDAPAAGVVVIHESYFPGWRATVDGRAASIEPANLLFRAVRVEPGHHRIVMTYSRPRYLVLGAISVLATLGAAFLVVWGRRRERT